MPASSSRSGSSIAFQPEPAGGGVNHLILLAIFAAPVLSGLVRRAAAGGWWFSDLDAVLCGAWRVAHGSSPYAQAAACPGGEPVAYVYLPQLAHLLSPLARGADISGLRMVFGAAVLAAATALAWIMYVRPMAGASGRFRAPFLGLTSPNAIASANVACVGHLMVFGAASVRRGGAWPLMLAIVVAAVLKPIMLTYLLIFAYQPERLAVRAWRIGGGLLLAAGAAALVVTSAGPDFAAWRAAIAQVALSPSQLGFGFLAWTYLLGVPPAGGTILAAYGAFAAVICLAGLVIAEAGRLDARSRVLLAMGVAQLVNPRLMIYDMLMLAPLAVAFQATPPAASGAFRKAVFAIGLMVALLQLSGLPGLFRIEPLLFSLMLVAAAVLVARQARLERDDASLPAAGPKAVAAPSVG
jgi:hypothetical protein